MATTVVLRVTKGAPLSAIEHDLNITNLKATADAAEVAAKKGTANGYAGLDATGKVPTSQLPDSVLGTIQFRGTWDANANTPTIPAAAAGNKGWYYVVQTAGSTSVSGVTDWKVGDWLVSDGTSWRKIDNTDTFTSLTVTMASDANVLMTINGGSTAALTANGTWTIAFNNVSPNLVFAGPVSGGAAKPIFRSMGTADLPAQALYYDHSVFVAGKPTASQVIYRHVCSRPFRVPASLTGSQMKTDTNATATATFSLTKNGTQFGTVAIGSTGTVTLTAASLTDFAAGDVFKVIAPSSVDATLADFGITIAASLL